LNRCRRRFNAARVHSHLTWEELFNKCDKNRDGCLDFREFLSSVRDVLKMPMFAVCDHDLKVLFRAIDQDGSQTIGIAELFEFVQHGAKAKATDETRRAKRMYRVKKNMSMALTKISTNEADIRKLFKTLDLDGNLRLSRFEFHAFARMELQLSKWDVMNADLDEFYYSLDSNGDGVDVEELLSVIQNKDGVSSTKKKLGPQNFYRVSSAPKVRKAKTYRQKLIEAHSERCHRSVSSPDLRLTSTFCSLGRDRRPASRGEVTRPSPL